MTHDDAMLLAQTAIVFSREFPDAANYTVAETVFKLDRLSRSICVVRVARCNADITAEAAAKKLKSLMKQVQKTLDQLATDIKFETGGDVRGASLLVTLPSGKSNGWTSGVWSF